MLVRRFSLDAPQARVNPTRQRRGRCVYRQEDKSKSRQQRRHEFRVQEVHRVPLQAAGRGHVRRDECP